MVLELSWPTAACPSISDWIPARVCYSRVQELSSHRQSRNGSSRRAPKHSDRRVILRSGAAPYHEKEKFLLLRTCSAAKKPHCGVEASHYATHCGVEASHLTSAVPNRRDEKGLFSSRRGGRRCACHKARSSAQRHRQWVVEGLSSKGAPGRHGLLNPCDSC